MDTPEDYREVPIEVDTRDVSEGNKLEKIEVECSDYFLRGEVFQEEMHYLPSGELFKYVLQWKTKKNEPLAIVGELVEGVWKYFYTKPRYALLTKGAHTFVTETYSYDSDTFLEPSTLVDLMASPKQLATQVSTRRRRIGEDKYETHIRVDVIMGKLRDEFDLYVRDNSYILEQEGEIVASYNLMQLMSLKASGPYDREIPMIFRKGSSFEIMTDDYLLALIPEESFYVGRLSGPIGGQMEG